MRQCNLSVEILGKGLEVHVGSVDVVVNVVKSVVGYVSVGDHHGLQTVLSSRLANVDDVFAPDGRLVVSERDGLAAIFQSQQRHVFRRNMLRSHLIGARFRNIPVLTEEAAHVAACRAHADGARSRQKMIQRLLFNGIHLQGGGRPVAKAKKLSFLVDAYETESRLAWPG